MSAPGWLPFAALSGCVAVTIAGALAYLARVRMPRPPVGVYSAGDLALVCASVVLAPLVDLALPRAVVAGLFGLVLGAAVQLTLAPGLGARRAWLTAAAAVGGELALAWAGPGWAVRAGTGVLLVVAVVGVANLWVQLGMRSRQVAVLAGVLAGYDLVASTLTAVTERFAAQVQGQPFAPLLAVTGGARPVAIGLGDLLLLVLFPLVAAKAFGRRAAVGAAAVGALVTSAVSLLFALGVLSSGFPLLTALGPLIVGQHLWWRRRLGGERNTAAWRARAGAGRTGLSRV